MVLRSTLEAIQTNLDKAVCPEDIFGLTPREAYRKLAATCHPDQAEQLDKDLAGEVFAHLGDWKQKADLKIAAGTYGDRTPVAPPKPPYKETEIAVGKTRLTLVSLISEGLISSVHEARMDGDKTGSQFFLKIARRPSDNDLLEREFRNLSKITAVDPNPNREKFFAAQRGYVPFPVQSFQIAAADGSKRRANLLVVPPQQHHSILKLRELNGKFRDGMDRRHMYWIFRRLLLTLWMAHQRGIVHGAPTPDHVLVYPKDHGIVLIDWTSSCEIGGKVPIKDRRWDSFYPPEISKRLPAQPHFDIYAAASTALYLCGASPHDLAKSSTLPDVIHTELATFCRNERPDRRPQDASDYFDRFGSVIEKLDGPRKYIELEV